MSIPKRLWEAVMVLENGNRTAFAKRIGVKRPTFLTYLAEDGGKRLRAEHLEAIAKVWPSVNINYIVTGYGRLLKSDMEINKPPLSDEEAEVQTPIAEMIRQAETGLRRAGASDKLVWTTVAGIAQSKLKKNVMKETETKAYGTLQETMADPKK